MVFTSSSLSEMCVMIPLLDDNLFEDSELFFVELINSQDATLVAPTNIPVVIEDDDSKI